LLKNKKNKLLNMEIEHEYFEHIYYKLNNNILELFFHGYQIIIKFCSINFGL